MVKKLIFLIALALGVGVVSRDYGLNFHQATAISIFSLSILGTLLFWDFRLSFAFLGIAALLVTHAIDLENLIRFSSLEVILFLVGMMIIIGLLKDAGFFAWIVTLILRIPHLTARKFVFSVSLISMLLACAVDEVTSIIFIVAAVLEICDYFEVEATPFIIISVLATNIGSAGTVLGNPIGVLIAAKSGLTFEDFIIKAFPLAAVCLLVMIFLVLLLYRKPLASLDAQIKALGSNEILTRLISVPPDKPTRSALWVFGVTIFFIAISHRLEVWFNLENNTVLLVIPLIMAAFVMIWKHNKAREFVEKDVEWWTLLFFLLLFAQAGTLKYTGATDVLAKNLAGLAQNSISSLTSMVLWIATIGSSVLDNVVLVAAFTPIIQSFQGLNINIQPLWWALLFGGCFGGNITMVGSTANIVAIGILEKEGNLRITFFRWLWIGLIVGIVTACIVWLALIFLPVYR